MSLSGSDRQLLQRCLDRAPGAWQNFVDRFLGLVVHVAKHTADGRGISIDQATQDDLVAEVFLTLIANDFAVLRRFRRNCSLATYLTVISRRVISRRLIQAARNSEANLAAAIDNRSRERITPGLPPRMENQEEVARLLQRLEPQEARVVQMYHLEGKTYQEISRIVGLSENSIGPVLTRARDKMRNGTEHS